MGAVGSFSEQAGEYYKNIEGLESGSIVPLVTAEAVLGALSQKAIVKAIFPVMNNNGGLVIEAIHALAKYQCSIENIFDMDIHHMSLVANDVTKDTVTTIISHDHQAVSEISRA